MSEQTTAAAEVTKATKQATVYETIEMEDGTKVDFPGKTRMIKSTGVEDGQVTLRVDFRNGAVRKMVLPRDCVLDAAAHGVSQKVGDSAASEKEIDDAVVAIETMMARLEAGTWAAERAAGDGFSGASVVIKAICEAKGQPVSVVKQFLEGLLAKNEGMTRAKLYQAFRNPESKTGQIILRMEKEKAAKATAGLNSDALLEEDFPTPA